MKPFLLLALVTLASLPSCDKVRALAQSHRETAPPTRAAKPFYGPLVSELAGSEYDTFPDQPGRVVVIDFYVDWCRPSRKLGGFLEKIATEQNGLVLIGKIHAEKFRDIAQREDVHSYPDFRIFRDGKLVARHKGQPPEEEVRRLIESQVKGLQPLPPEVANPPKQNPTGPLAQPMDKDWLPPGMQRR